MQKRNMRIPRCARGNAESERMVFRQTEIIRKSFICKSERARRISVPGVRRYYLQSRSQLRLKDLFRFGFVRRQVHGGHITPREIHTSNDRVVQRKVPPKPVRLTKHWAISQIEALDQPPQLKS